MSDEARSEALLRRMRVSLPLPEPEPERAERIAARLDGKLAELVAEDETRARRRRWFQPLLVAASVALLIGAGWVAKGKWMAAGEGPEGPFELLRGHVELAQSGFGQAARPEFRVGKEEAELVLASGAQVRLEPATLFGISLSAGAEGVVLPSGKVSLSVPKLGSRKLTVETAEAIVTVHGTRFTVERSEGDGGRTRVTVSEGRVEVRAGPEVAMLGPGGFWESQPRVMAQPPALPTQPAAGTSVAETTEPLVAQHARGKTHSGRRSAALEGPASSSLPAENKLFRAAASAKARADFPTALRYFDELLRRYPESPLAQNAEVERFRVLRSMKREEAAAQAAREYLSRHADGFARTEAKDVALRPLPSKETKSADGK